MGEDRMPEPGSFRARWAAHLTALVGPRDKRDLAEKLGIKPDFMRKVLTGERSLGPEKWESLGDLLGLADYREVLPPAEKKSQRK